MTMTLDKTIYNAFRFIPLKGKINPKAMRRAKYWVRAAKRLHARGQKFSPIVKIQ